jgi:DNA-binding NarL/FixJ family response regulator
VAISTVPSTALEAVVLAPATLGIVARDIERQRLKALLEASSFEVGAGAGDVNTLLDRASRTLDLVLFVGGPELLARGGQVELLRNLRPASSMVIVSSAGTAVVRKALRAGVDGFVPDAEVEQALAGTVAAVLAGQISVPRSIRSRITWTAFSLREKQVLQLVAAGLTNAEIADRLFLSESTVKSHLSSSFRKLGVSSRAEAAAAVLDPDNGLVFGQAAAAPNTPLEQQLLSA